MKSALILIDIQNDYFPGGNLEIVGMTQAAAKAREVLTAWRQARLPLVHVQHVSLGTDAAFFRPHTVGVNIHESLQPLDDEPVIRKHYPNAFRETGLMEALKTAGGEELVICGAMSHMCIDATTRAAFDFGFRCTVIHDACATRDLVFEGLTIPAAHVHGAFMAALGMRYASLRSAQQFLSGL
jgi:nicotinamidase-related amidase